MSSNFSFGDLVSDWVKNQKIAGVYYNDAASTTYQESEILGTINWSGDIENRANAHVICLIHNDKVTLSDKLSLDAHDPNMFETMKEFIIKTVGRLNAKTMSSK